MSDDHIKRTYIVEEHWKCIACAEANPGRFLKCQKCGAPKHKSVEEAVDAEAAEVSDAALLEKANAGANWICAYCGSQDRTKAGRCGNCGAKQDEAKAGTVTGAPSVGATPAPAALVALPVKKRRTGLFVALGLLGSCGLGVGMCVMPHEKAAKVASTHWVYTVDLEHRELTHGSGFNAPSDAFNKRCEQRQNGTHNCEPYSCNSHSVNENCRPHDCNCHKVTHSKGNGFSEVQEVCSTCYDQCPKTVQDTCYHQCPTYAQWCSYDAYQWNKLRTEKAEGDSAETHWPSGSEAQGPDQRAQKHEAYEVVFDANGERYTHAPESLAEFRKYTRGASWKVKVNAAGTVWPEAPER
jgi:hypothetical protein